ncbi:MAG: hypothetical protein ACLFWD_09050 [Anaerolineales bacterium]
MSERFPFSAVFKATLFGLVVSYLVCLAGDLIFGWTMYEVWAPLLPGFEWPLTVPGFLLGLVWLVVYAGFLQLVFLLPFNYLMSKEQISN